jgi:hypothetical protein
MIAQASGVVIVKTGDLGKVISAPSARLLKINRWEYFPILGASD